MGVSSKIKGNYWLRSGVYTIGQRFSTMAFGLVNFLILARATTKEEFGTLALFISVITILEVLRNGFLRNGLIRGINHANSEEEKTKIKGSSFGLSMIFSVIQALLFLTLAQPAESLWGASELAQMLYIQIVGSFLAPFFWHFEYLGQANRTFRGFFWSHFIRRGGFTGYIAILWFTDMPIDLTELSIAFVVFQGVGALVGWILTRFLAPLKMKWDRETASDLFHYGKYTFGTNVSAQSLKNIDQWFLGGMIGTSAVAAYNPAIRISSLVEVPTLSVASMLFPELTKRVREEGIKVATELYEQSVSGIMALTLPTALIVLIFPEFIINVLAGPKYLDTVDILRVTIFYTLFIPYARQFGVVLDAIGLQKVNFYFVLFSAILNILFNYLFISAYGTIGAAYGTLATYGVGFIYNQWYLAKKLGTNPLRTLLGVGAMYQKIFLLIRKKV